MGMGDKKLLLVDDDQELCEELEDIFTDQGFSVETICNGSEALKRLQKEFYDVLVLDIKIPGASGFDILEMLRTEGKGIKTIVLTGRPLNSDLTKNNTAHYKKEEELLAYADEVMNKPFDIDDLIITVKSVVA
jgi:DNA-binding response OmpR family regulator